MEASGEKNCKLVIHFRLLIKGAFLNQYHRNYCRSIENGQEIHLATKNMNFEQKNHRRIQINEFGVHKSIKTRVLLVVFLKRELEMVL